MTPLLVAVGLGIAAAMFLLPRKIKNSNLSSEKTQVNANGSAERDVDINQGEGNRTAARAYNEHQRRFAQSGRVEEAALEAKETVDGRGGL